MATRFCSHCGRMLGAGSAFCASCGAPVPTHVPPSYSTTPPPPPAPPRDDAPQTHAPPPQTYAPSPQHPSGMPPVSQGLAIAALILNVIIWPGLGSLVAGRQVGWAQGFLFLAGIPLALILIGIPMLIGAWVWGLITGIELIRAAPP